MSKQNGRVSSPLSQAITSESLEARYTAADELAAILGPVIHALSWSVENAGECLADHPKRLAAYRAALERLAEP